MLECNASNRVGGKGMTTGNFQCTILSWRVSFRCGLFLPGRKTGWSKPAQDRHMVPNGRLWLVVCWVARWTPDIGIFGHLSNLLDLVVLLSLDFLCGRHCFLSPNYLFIKKEIEFVTQLLFIFFNTAKLLFQKWIQQLYFWHGNNNIGFTNGNWQLIHCCHSKSSRTATIFFLNNILPPNTHTHTFAFLIPN